MKKILIAWIAMLFIACIAANFLVKNQEKKKVAAATPKVVKVLIPEKRAEPAEKPKIAEEPKVVEKTIRVAPEKPEEVEKLKAEIATLGQKIKVLEEAKTVEKVEKPEAEIAEKPEIRRYEPRYLPEAQAREPEREETDYEEPYYEERYAAYTPLIIYDICPSFFPLLRLGFYPFLPWYPGILAWIDWYDLYYWNYYYPRRYYYRSIFADYYNDCYDRLGHYGQTTIHKNQLQNRRTLTNNGRITTNVTSDQLRSLSKSPHGISPISRDSVNQTLKSNSLKTYPSRIDSSRITAHQGKTTAFTSNSGRFESPWGHLGAPKKSVASGSSSGIYPNRRSSSKSPTTKSFRGASPKSFSKSPSGSFRSSSGSFRSSSRSSTSTRSAPSRSSGSIRKK